MHCDCDQLQRYHDGELDAAEMRNTEAHLAACEKCRSELAELRAFSAMVAASPLPEVDQNRLALIADRAWRATNDRGVRKLAGWITAAAAALMLVALVDFPQRNVDYAQTSPASQTPQGSGAMLTSEWERNAIMPLMPVALSVDEGDRDLVQFAQWMASDLGTTRAE